MREKTGEQWLDHPRSGLRQVKTNGEGFDYGGACYAEATRIEKLVPSQRAAAGQ